MDCLNPSCTDPAHLFHIDQYSINVIKILEDSAAEYIPYTRSVSEKSSKKRKSIPGWVELVKPHQDKAQFWYQIWHSAGKPVVGELFNIMRFTRNQYKYARRKCLRAVETTKRDKFVEACVRGDKHMFEELKKIRQSKCATVSKVDGISDPDKIADHFGHVYRDIYNREANNEPLKELFIEVNQSCVSDDLGDVERVNEVLIRTIIKEKLKCSKIDPEFDLTTDALKNSPDNLFTHLANIFRAMLVHGHMPDVLLFNAIVPLIKDKNGKLDDLNN